MKSLIAKFPQLVFACAWCGPQTYPPLKAGQVHTHGLCHHHKALILVKAANKGS